YILCCDPDTAEEEIRKFFPEEKKSNGHAGSLMVYPRVKQISNLHVPEELEAHPGFDKHTMFPPADHKVPKMEGYGAPHGVVYFHHHDSNHVKQGLQDFVDHDFYM